MKLAYRNVHEKKKRNITASGLGWPRKHDENITKNVSILLVVMELEILADDAQSAEGRY